MMKGNETTMMDIQVIKRNGLAEAFSNEKINKVLEWATNGVSGVNPLDIVMRAKLSITDGIKTSDIHDALISATEDLITIQTPNYDKVASNLLNYKLRKLVWGGKNPPKLIDHIRKMVDCGFYDKKLLENYPESMINKIDEIIDHERDFIYSYGGLTQLCSKYLVQERTSKSIKETPQFMTICMAMTLGFSEPEKTRFEYIRDFYDETSKNQSINWPTPILSGARTPTRSFSSCGLIDVLDTKQSLYAANTSAGLLTCDKYGIGLNLSRIRPLNSPIGAGDTLHSGVIAWLKMFQETIKCSKQGAARRGSATVTFPIFHPEIKTILTLKNNQGTHENRVPHLDYSIGMSGLFWDRLVKEEPVSLFSSKDVPHLYESLGTSDLEKIYLECEKDKSIPRTTISTRHNESDSLTATLLTETLETARIYIINLDNANEFSPWKEPVRMSNLCQEILHPLKAERYTNDPEAEIGVCVLAAVNMYRIKSDAHHRKVCKLIVKTLNHLIDVQEYTVKGCANFALNKRSIRSD